MTNDNGSFDLNEGYVYFDDLANGFQVAGIAPNRGPLDGGNDVWIAGNGFTEQTRVEFDERNVDCAFENANQLRCTAPPGVEAVSQSVSYKEMLVSTSLEDTPTPALELIAITPDSGSIAGGALVTYRLVSPGHPSPLGDRNSGGPVLDDSQSLESFHPTPQAPSCIALTEFSRARIRGLHLL